MGLYMKKNNQLVALAGLGDYYGIPVGAVQGFALGTQSPDWLLCDGRDTTGQSDELHIHYPALYTYLGNSNVLPDYRECTLVGVGQNDTDTIAEHDVYTLGQFKDDQLQNITGALNRVLCSGSGAFAPVNNSGDYNIQAVNGSIDGSKHNVLFDASRVTRAGTTTHGKQKGVAFYIKATSARPEVDTDIYATKGYIRDQNLLSKWEDITIPDSSHTITMQYDGELYFVRNASKDEWVCIDVNGYPFTVGVGSSGGDYNYVSAYLPFTKGDVISSDNPGYAKVRYYKLRDYTGR